jgi:hypothetical protein
MNKLKFYVVLLLSVVTTTASPQYDNLIKLVKSGAGEEVVVAYIHASDSAFNLSSDEIVQLKESGASSAIIIAAMHHNGSAKTYAATPAPIETSAVAPSHRTYEVYQVVPPWRTWRVVRNYWYNPNVSKMNQALQIDISRAMLGGIALNYEYLLFHQHGLVVEGSYYPGWNSHGENAQLAYRWHFSKSMESGFLGAFVNYGKYHGTIYDYWGDAGESYNHRSLTVGPNIGKRWVSASGFSLVARVGYGYTWNTFDKPAPDQSTINRIRWESGFDSELSVGFAF